MPLSSGHGVLSPKMLLTTTGCYLQCGGRGPSHPAFGRSPIPGLRVGPSFKGDAWSARVWRLSAFLRREAAPPASAVAASDFVGTSKVRLMFLRRLVTFRLLLDLVGQGSALWFRRPLAPSFAAFLVTWTRGAVFASTVPLLGFGTVLALPCRLPAIFGFLCFSHGSSGLSVFRLASPHLRSSSGVALLR